ncbi:uncharacterized protein [Triticum aestivum]|uniref:uncharacterized protein n=1 Tax=Triticum aestivum TaxID=4565 RepID=UPI001D02D38D|nr:uncharacterized protein LOC123156901 [Triticum aestivum]
MADGATTATLLVAHGGRRRSGRGGLLLMLLLYPLHLSAAAPESECAKFAGPRAHLRWLRFIRPVPRCVRRVASSCATPAPPPPTTPLRMPLQHPRAIVGSLRPAPPLPGAGCSSPRAPSRSQEADMYGGSTSLVPSIPSGDAHPLFSNVSVIYSLASSLPQVRRNIIVQRWLQLCTSVFEAADATTSCLYKCSRRTALERTTRVFEREGWKRGGWSKRRGRSGATCYFFVIDVIPPL